MCWCSRGIWAQLQHSVTSALTHGQVLVVGDLNARTGHLADFPANDDADTHLQSGCLPTRIVRNNQDAAVNVYGRKLLKLCHDTGVRIVNGRVPGDPAGSFTYVQLQHSVTSALTHGQVLVVGDLNARTGHLADFPANDDADTHLQSGCLPTRIVRNNQMRERCYIIWSRSLLTSSDTPKDRSTSQSGSVLGRPQTPLESHLGRRTPASHTRSGRGGGPWLDTGLRFCVVRCARQISDRLQICDSSNQL